MRDRAPCSKATPARPPAIHVRATGVQLYSRRTYAPLGVAWPVAARVVPQVLCWLRVRPTCVQPGRLTLRVHFYVGSLEPASAVYVDCSA